MGHIGGPRTAVYTKIVTAMTAEALGGTTVMRHDADTRSIHSNNDWEHQQRPLDVVMTTQPSSRRRLAEAQGSEMRGPRFVNDRRRRVAGP